ncbi:MAG: hypothetical protein J5614_03670 [Paludibacteraceae bacterium]|nr:hypothetical protein [Paludibacteraceae bacterium]
MMNNNRDNKDIKFTGDPVAFDGVEGKRDPKTGKGRFDLIPEEVFGPLFDRVHTLETTEPYTVDCTPASILNDIANEDMLDAIIKITILKYYKTNPTSETEILAAKHLLPKNMEVGAFLECCWDMFLDLAIHFQKGAEHYGERNCQKGIPKWSFKDSAMRHASQTFAGKTDEPHTISVIWNCWLFVWSEIHERQEKGLELVGMKLRTAEEIAAAKSATPTSELKVMKLQSALKEVREAGYTVVKPASIEDAIKAAANILIAYRKELKKDMFMHIKGSPEYEAFNRDQLKLRRMINMMHNITIDIPCVITGNPISHEEAKAFIEKLKKFSEEHETPVVTAVQNFYTREEVEAIKKETIEDYLTKRDNVTEIVQKIVKKFGAPCIIKALDEFNELMYNGDAFIHEFVKFMDTPEGKERARWFYGPDDLFKDLIDRVENTRGAGQDYHDYVPLLLQLNSAYTEFLNNAES